MKDQDLGASAIKRLAQPAEEKAVVTSGPVNIEMAVRQESEDGACREERSMLSNRLKLQTHAESCPFISQPRLTGGDANGRRKRMEDTGDEARTALRWEWKRKKVQWWF